MRNSVKGSIAVAALAIAFSADSFLPDTMPPIFAGQALAASANGHIKSNNGNGGTSADAGSHSKNAPPRASPASGQGNGGGPLHLLAIGGTKPPSAGSAATAGIATGAPLELLESQAVGATAATAPVGPPDPKPDAPATAYVMETAAATGQRPGDIQRQLVAGRSDVNSNEQAKLSAPAIFRTKPVERYFQADADLQAALTAAGGAIPSDAEYADAQAYLGAVAVQADPGSFEAEEIAAAGAVINGFPFLDAASAQVVADAYEAVAPAAPAIQDADNRP